jgi:hypothetical protein
MHKIIHNVITGEIVEVPLTAEEITDLENRQEIAVEMKAEKTAAAEANATAKAALLAKLGITAEEAALLLS